MDNDAHGLVIIIMFDVTLHTMDNKADAHGLVITIMFDVAL